MILVKIMVIQMNKLTKDGLTEIFKTKLLEKISEKKNNISTELLKEVDARLPSEPVKITRFQLEGGSFRYQFSYNSRIYIVDFKLLTSSKSEYTAQYYIKGKEDSTNPSNVYGNITTIQPIFANVLRCIEQFLELKKPAAVRLVPTGNVTFPSQFHRHMFIALKAFDSQMKVKYSIMRDGKDGSAFVLKKGGASDNLKSAGWNPNTNQTATPSK